MPSKAKTTPVSVAWDSLGIVQMALTKLNSKKTFNAFFLRHKLASPFAVLLGECGCCLRFLPLIILGVLR